ncbi:tetratricopeptide repeat-containing protein [Cryptosporidium felis]|nr:tetratricopeptide repeat-containing protein [Cryptosporidium felis]
MYSNVEETVCKLMNELGKGNVSAIQSTLKGIDPGLIKHSLERFSEEGRAQFNQKKYQDAINSFSQAISGYKIELKDKDKVELSKLLSNRSLCYLKLGQEENYVRAFEDAKECILLNPNWSKGWYRAGKALYNLNIFDKAVTVFKAALRREDSTSNPQNSLKEIQDLIEICEKKADHEAALKRVTVDYSRFEDALKELEIEELREEMINSNNEEASSNSQNIINLPTNFGNVLPGDNSSLNGGNLQLELSPDLSQDEIDNLKLSLGGSISAENSAGDKSKKNAKVKSKYSGQLLFEPSQKFKKSDPKNSENDNIKGISRLIQLSSEIQWFRRIIENFVDQSNLYLNKWIQALNKEISLIKDCEKSNVVFIGSGSFILPIYYSKNSHSKNNVMVTTQAKYNSSCLFRLYSNLAASNNIFLANYNSLHPELHQDFGLPQNTPENDPNEAFASTEKNSIRLVHGNIQSLKSQFWKNFTPSSIIIDPSIFEPGILGMGLIPNITSISKGIERIEARISVTPSIIKVFIQFSNIKIPPLKLESETCVEEIKDNHHESSNKGLSDVPEISMDKLNEGLWSPYWEPLKVSNAYPHISYISDPIMLGFLPLEKIMNDENSHFFLPNLVPNGKITITSQNLEGDSGMDSCYKGEIDFTLEPETRINSVILTFRAIKESEDEEITLLDSSSQLTNVENKSVISPAVNWLGGNVVNNGNTSINLKFDFQVENTRIVISPNFESLTALKKQNKISTSIPNKFISSLPRSVIENLWDVKSVEIWSKSLVTNFKSSVIHNTAGKIFEGIITSTSPGAFLPILLLYTSSKINKSNKNSLFSNWKKSDVHFTCIENLPNVQELYLKVIRDNIHILLPDIVEGEIKTLYTHSINPNDSETVKSKYWKPITSSPENSSINLNKELDEKQKYYQWIMSNSSARHILNKKLSERLTIINGDVRQIFPNTANIGPNQSNIQYHFIEEKARLFTGMNFDHDGLGEGIIPLWANAFQNGIVRKYNSNKIPNIPIPNRISFYGYIARIGPNIQDELKVDTSFWDTYRFEGNSQWAPLNNIDSYSMVEMSDIFHIITIDLNSEEFVKLSNWKNEINFQIKKQGRANSVIVFFDLWIDSANILTTNPFCNRFERPNIQYLEENTPSTTSSSLANSSPSFASSEEPGTLNPIILTEKSPIEVDKKLSFHKTAFWKPVFHMIPQHLFNTQDSIDLEFSLDERFTQLKFKIKAINSSSGETTPSTITSDEIENSPSVLPPLGDIAHLQLRERYNSIIKEISPAIYSGDSVVSLQAFTAALNIAFNPGFFQGENAIIQDDTPFEIDSLNWLSQSFLL